MNFSRNDLRMLAMTILYQIDLFKRKEIDYNWEVVLDENLVEVDADIDILNIKKEKYRFIS